MDSKGNCRAQPSCNACHEPCGTIATRWDNHNNFGHVISTNKLSYKNKNFNAGDQEISDSTTIQKGHLCGDFLCELDRYGKDKNKPFPCKCLLDGVYRLLEELSTLRKQEGIGICNHCKHNTCDIDCPKCRYLIEKFFATNKEAREEYSPEKLKTWLHKFRHLLKSLFSGECTTQTAPCNNKCTDMQLKKLLQDLNEPQHMRELDIEVLFPSSTDPIRLYSYDEEQKNVIDKKTTKELDQKRGLRKCGKKIGKKIKQGQGTTGESERDKNVGADLENRQELLGDGMSKSDEEDKIKSSRKSRNKNLHRRKRAAPNHADEIDALKCRPASEMILGNRIVPYKPKKRMKQLRKEPLYFKKVYEVKDDAREKLTSSSTAVTVDNSKPDKKGDTPAFLNYALSNTEFIEKEFTVLPKRSIMQQVVFYRTTQSEPQYDWFKINTDKMPLYYEAGQLLAKADESNGACWFYRNGNIALIYYNNEENHVLQRYEVFNTGKDENGSDRPVAVLAVFDFNGNCVVYDHDGRIRLKYNQAEGVVYDRTIAPPSRWLWHNLNRSPPLQLQLVDEKCSEQWLMKMLQATSEATESALFERDEKMAAVELENCLKQNRFQTKRPFKPFAIRPKIFKLNEHFSLRITDQSCIHLLFRDGKVNLKLHLGFALLTEEICEIAMTEVGNVLTPYDEVPPTPVILSATVATQFDSKTCVH